MIRAENRRSWVPRTAELTFAASLAATYIITTYIPLTPFIGGPGFITLEIVMLPIIAALLRPIPALATVFVGSLGMFFFSSRRRHTRLQGDWSSDVCSSD